MHKIGVRIAIDDYGTGFSSLSYLRSFPISKLKIDRTFIRDLPDDPDAMAIARAVVGLANSLGIVSTAEGVETEQQLEALRAMGCSEMQGYLLSLPRPLKEVVRPSRPHGPARSVLPDGPVKSRPAFAHQNRGGMAAIRTASATASIAIAMSRVDRLG